MEISWNFVSLKKWEPLRREDRRHVQRAPIPKKLLSECVVLSYIVLIHIVLEY